MVEPISCPRRISELGPWQRHPGLDRFDSVQGRTCTYKICSFCGSLDPETALNWMANGGRITPTDKSYKMYISISKEKEQKFYFQHFDKSQRAQFISMYNLRNRPFLMGYPGYFYVLPFFAGRQLDDD